MRKLTLPLVILVTLLSAASDGTTLLINLHVLFPPPMVQVLPLPLSAPTGR